MANSNRVGRLLIIFLSVLGLLALLFYSRNDGALDFLEVGTSDFDTLLQKSGKNVRGISIDALQIYLDRLPRRWNVIKHCAAVVPTSTQKKTVPVYFIPPKALKEYNLPYLFRGCNRVGQPHETVMKTLRAKNLTHIVRKKDVPVLTPGRIFDIFKVKSIKILKLDIEGFDAQLITDFLTEITKRSMPLPRFVIYEENVLSPEKHISHAENFVKNLGYDLYKTGSESMYYGLTDKLLEDYIGSNDRTSYGEEAYKV